MAWSDTLAKGPDGQVQYIIKTGIDQTERQQAEDQLRMVAEFRQTFIGIVGHGLRNLLGTIGMAAGLLLRRSHLDQNDRELIGRIVRSGQRMTRMISHLVDVTRA